MLRQLGGIIEKRPWIIVGLIIIITIGFSLFLPAIEFKTDFRNFTPDDPIVKANSRVFEYFGSNQQIIFALIHNEKTSSILDPESIREINYIQKNILEIPEINGSFSIVTFVDMMCQLEFGASLENCSERQLQMAITDLFTKYDTSQKQLFSINDADEPVDFKRFPRISRGKSVNSVDIKNCYLTADNTTFTVSFEVYDLSAFTETISPPIPRTNVMEWYLSFDNLIQPDKQLDIQYRIALHLEPKYPLWEVGKGVFANLRNLMQIIRNRELFTYNQAAYLWIKPPDQTMYFPLPLETSTLRFDTSHDVIQVQVSRDELSRYGIAPRFGSFELPAKLTNFSAGTRYYQPPISNRPGGRLTANLSYLIQRLQRLQQRPILGSITQRFLQNQVGLTWEEFDDLFALINQNEMAPETIALKDIESLWKYLDIAPDKTGESTIFFIPTSLISDTRIEALALLSEDYEQTGRASASLLIIQLPFGDNYEEMIALNTQVLQRLHQLDDDSTAISTDVTGEGIVSMQINELTSEANQLIGPGIFIIIIFILYINFRKLSYVFLPMLALGVSTVWLFGTMSLLGIPFNVIAVALVPLILGLGVDYAVHLFHNYRSELEDGKKPAEAIKKSVEEIGTAMFLAMITTVIAFMSFLSASVPPIRDFGILLALGVTYTFITAITLLASLRYILDRNKEIKPTRKLHLYSVRNIMGRLAQTVVGHKKKILFSILLITIILGSGASQLQTGFDMNQFVPEGNEAVELFDEIAEKFPYSSQDQEYILIEGDIATVDTLQSIRQTHMNMKDDTYISENPDGSLKTTSVYTLLQQAIQNNASLIDAFNINPDTYIPRSDQDVYDLFMYLYGEDIDLETIDVSSSMTIDPISFEFRSVLYKEDSDFTATVIRMYIDPSIQADDQDLMDGFAVLHDEIQSDIAEYGEATAVATGNFIVTLTITSSLTESQILSTGISIILAAIVVIIAYRSVTLGIITMIPVGFTIVWILGTMYYIGYTLNALTITVTSITIGIGIDYAIHSTERFRFVADKTGDVVQAVGETISHTGGALFIAAMTTTFGFGILMLAPIPPQQQFGLIIAVTIIFAFITSVLILPLALVRWGKSRKKRKGYIITPSESDEIDEKLKL